MTTASPPPASSPTGYDARRRRILRCASEAFLADGYAATSVEDIAIEASVSKLTIYSLFTDKLGLATAVLTDLSDILERECRTAIDMEAEPEDCLLRVCLTYIRWMNERIGKAYRYEVLRLLVEMARPHPEFARVWIDKSNAAMANPLTTYVDKCIHAGKMSGDDPHFIAAQFVSSLSRGALAIVANLPFPNDRDWAEKKVRLFLNGCAGKAPSQGR